MKVLDCVLTIPMMIFWWTSFVVVYVWSGLTGLFRNLTWRSK